ncbi:MAG: hypothetical protein K2F81_07060 [Ruminococcus sp.]|nr:hypothetical protein [Ruminococcus sp.]
MVPPEFMQNAPQKSYNGDKPMPVKHTHKAVSEFIEFVLLSADGTTL